MGRGRGSLKRGWQALALLVASLLFPSAHAETLVIAGDIWCPINCEPGSRKPGVFVELAQEIFGEAGIDVEYRLVNWARAVHDTRNGRLDALIGAGIQDAPDFVFTATPPGVSRMCFYVAPNSQWRYRGLESLANVRLGSINSYSYGQELDTYIRIKRDDPARVQVVSGDQALEMNVEKVLLGRIDATIENAWVMDAWLAESGQQGKLVKAGCRLPDVPIFLAFSPALKGSARHAALFDTGLKRLRESGRMNALLQRYGLPPLD
ncbi:transporter substrate-binding domain-containing protein [Pseudomonas sp. JS3066]|jgi:polar amino acid transport system substrate-binding protein|uniref:substrate-binding periplasmic protein n=1 Tax=Pseudomonas sp. JS3066 TaxID=3090665 RepID=UPI000EA98404|nr:transporter substrate-binding domain-containing protein [Pseudomonas sp. JS3066]AYF87979.1 ABC transporter substrate-binding protein [Pseudomonas sp. DY-1]WVK94448.1 transporter substrate-binding domain-containing protein [Pseudomonas sp. JS3066]